MAKGKVKALVLRWQEIALCFARNWWRPIAQWGLALSVFVNTIYLPIQRGEGVDLGQLALLITSFAPIVAIRAWEKGKPGSAENPDQEPSTL